MSRLPTFDLADSALRDALRRGCPKAGTHVGESELVRILKTKIRGSGDRASRIIGGLDEGQNWDRGTTQPSCEAEAGRFRINGTLALEVSTCPDLAAALIEKWELAPILQIILTLSVMSAETRPWNDFSPGTSPFGLSSVAASIMSCETRIS